MVEILAGALAGGAVQDKVHSANWGNLIMAIDPGKLGGSTQDFSAKVTALLQRVKGAQESARGRGGGASRREGLPVRR